MGFMQKVEFWRKVRSKRLGSSRYPFKERSLSKDIFKNEKNSDMFSANAFFHFGFEPTALLTASVQNSNVRMQNTNASECANVPIGLSMIDSPIDFFYLTCFEI